MFSSDYQSSAVIGSGHQSIPPDRKDVAATTLDITTARARRQSPPTKQDVQDQQPTAANPTHPQYEPIDTTFKTEAMQSVRRLFVTVADQNSDPGVLDGRRQRVRDRAGVQRVASTERARQRS